MKGFTKYHFFLIVFLSGIISFSTIAQGQQLKDDLTRIQNGEDLKLLYRHESSWSVYIHSAGGFGIGYRRGIHVTGKRKKMFEVETNNFKHQKEIKTSNSYYANSKGYIYGKLNSVLVTRAGVGYQNALYQKNDKKNVEIRYSTFVGATLAFAKPVYLEIRSSNGSAPTEERYDPTIHKQEDIYGKAPFLKGVDKTRIYPAGYAKVALSFEYGDKYNAIKALETGAVADVYPYALPLMAYTKKQQVFISLYLKLVWGKKWF